MSEQDKVVCYKDIQKKFGVSRSTALRMATATRRYYDKTFGGPITMAQVKRANKLEE